MPRAAERSDRGHRQLLFALTVLLVAFSAWCVDLWVQQSRLRSTFDLRLGWLGDLRTLEARLDATSPGSPPAAALLEKIAPIAAGAPEDPSIQVAVRRLADALRMAATESEDEDAAWTARVGAREAAAALRTELLGDLDSLHDDLRRHWGSIGWLLICALGLAASNLGLLALAHRRRLELETAHREALELASHDHLTGLWTREEILGQLRRELARVRRSPTSLGVVLADLDEFGATNDFLGQDEGDRVLRQVADRLRVRLRAYDQVGRFGGDAFLFVLPTCDEAATRTVAERLRAALQEPLEHRLGHVELTATFAWDVIRGPRDVDPDNVVRRLGNRLEETRANEPGTVGEQAAGA